MEGVFLEFENENALRSYPFAEGCETYDIPPGVFVDAMLYPVNPSGVLYLSEISEDGVFSISDDTGVIMTGTASGASVELYDLSVFKRHVGTLEASSAESLSEFSGRGTTRTYGPSNTAFASDCVFPVVIDGVISLSVGGTEAADGAVGFSNGDSDSIRVSSSKTSEGNDTLRFDVIPRPAVKNETSIRRIICVVDGQTPFRIDSAFNEEKPEDGGYNSVVLRLYPGVDKGAVCSAAHRENQFEMADTCDCENPPLPEGEPLPETYQLVEVFIPPDKPEGNGVFGPNGGIKEGADNAFYLIVPNLSGYDNPLSITLEDGEVSPKTTDLKTVENGSSVELAEGEMLDKITSKIVILQVPGLAGGQS